MAATLGNLEVTTKILFRLPPETLLRLKSVHKSWYALIHDPKFVSNHFSNSLQHEHIFLKRVVTNDSGKEEIMFSILNFPLDPYLSMSIQNVDLPYYEHSQYFQIHGHSHGLVCVSDPNMNVFLCNPATREFRKLPPSIFPVSEPPYEPQCYGYDLCMNAVGFGYDANSRDFKVVRLVDFVERYGYFLYKKAEIYELSKDRWREIEPPVRGDVIDWIPSFEMFHEGTYYWLSYERDADFILSFNMSDEVFSQISLPESFNMKEDGWENNWSMKVLNGSIVVVLYQLEANEKIFDIWEMEKNDESGVSWSKLLRIGPISGIDKPLLFVSSDELLMEAKEGHLILYHIKTQQMKELPIKGNQDLFEATHYVKSLFSVKGGNNSVV